MGVTQGKLYFASINSPNDRLEIQFVPDELGISRTPDLAGVKVVGRNIPDYVYSSGETILTFQLDFFSEEADRKDVLRKVRWLESFTANDGYNKPPSRLLLVFGDVFKNQKWAMKSINYKLKNFAKTKGYMPQQAYVDLTLALDVDGNPKQKDIREV